MQFEKVVDGVMRYLDREIFSKMSPWQEVIARAVVGRYAENTEGLKQSIINNGFIRSMGVVDHEGNVDVDSILHSLKREIERKGSVDIAIPMFGKVTIKPVDIDVLRNDLEWR